MVKGNFRRSASSLKSSGRTPAVVELLPVVRHVLVGVAQRPFEPLALQRRDLVARGELDRLELLPARPELQHQGLPSSAEQRALDRARMAAELGHDRAAVARHA